MGTNIFTIMSAVMLASYIDNKYLFLILSLVFILLGFYKDYRDRQDIKEMVALAEFINNEIKEEADGRANSNTDK